MNIKQKVKGLWGKLRKNSKRTEAAKDFDKSRADSELSAEEVVEKEIFPPKKTAAPARRVARKTADTEAASDSPSKPAKKQSGKRSAASHGLAHSQKGKKGGTRPTNPGYEMIDPDDNTCDSSQS